MNLPKINVLPALTVLLMLGRISHAAESDKPIRVGIRAGVDQVDISCDVKMVVRDMSSNEETFWAAGKNTFTAKDGELLVNDRPKGKAFKLSPWDEEHFFIRCNDRGYRGALIVKVTEDSRVTVVNELGVDDYLKGVLPREVVVSWPYECLRAQAVASRTYLASHLGRHNKDGFDLCSDVHCQVYGGVAKEHPECSRAVDDTHNEVLVYEGNPIGAFFHSNCGGTTEQIAAVWGQTNRPYLPRKKCPYGKGDPRYSWKLTMANADILQLLKAKTKVQGDTLESITVKKKSPSGRAETVTVKTNTGRTDLMGNDFRIALNPEKIRSTLWTIVRKLKGSYTFEGMGWGHGVGMCQWGAKGQAEAGKTYQQILSYYYPHSTLHSWDR